MDDSIIVLSSDDETAPEKDVKVDDSKAEVKNIKVELDVNPVKEEIVKAGSTKRKKDDRNGEAEVSQSKKPKHTSNDDSTGLGNSSKDASSSSKDAGSSSKDADVHENPESSVLIEFISTCLKLDDSPSMKIILDTKLKKYYSLLIPEYQKSEQFYLLLERKQAEILRCPSHLYRHLKEFIDELKIHRSDKAQSKAKASDRFIRKLCKAMEILHRKIKKLEEREVDWDDDNESVYLQLQRYRERFIKIHNKLQELEGNTKAIFKRKISFSGTQFPSINRAIEKFVNTKGEFPDYHDIHDLLNKSYTSEGVDVSSAQLRAEAKSVFQNVGDQLQKQRKYECWEVHSSFLENDDDPAEENLELRSVLEENKKIYGSRIDEVINSFAEQPSKSQFASDDSNSSSALRNEVKDKQEDVNGKEEQENDTGGIEVTEKAEEIDVGEGQDGDHEDDDPADDNSDNEEEDEEEVEDNASRVETMEDILNDIDNEPNEEYNDELNLYHGPVSPPKDQSDKDTENVSPLRSPGDKTEEEGAEQEEQNILNVVKDVPKNECVNEESDNEPAASCSNQNESDSFDSKENLSENLVQPSEETKPYLKVKPLSSLQGKVSATKDPEEILLD